MRWHKIEEESQKELEEYQSADAGDVINESTDDLTGEGLSGLPENGLNEETQDPASSGTGTSGDDTQSGQNDGLSTQDGTDTGTATENGTGSQTPENGGMDSQETAGGGNEINFSEGTS